MCTHVMRTGILEPPCKCNGSVFLGALIAVLIIRVLDGTLLQLAALQIECSKP